MVLAASRRVRYSDNEFCQSLQPPLVLKPILTFPKGRNKLPCFVKDLFSQSFQPPLVLKPILTFPKGRNKLPCFVKDLFSQSFQPPLVLPRRGDADYSGSVKDREMLVTLAYDNR
ncbi:hypothetical protein ST41_02255 [Prevotella pectinovora]|nr:hypothetical protein ST41_02255 [Prevotella pectinovora]